tara:strand:- start:44 stop:253 length:210 start_codon:yes stop_codon:yes gene_type:complete
MLVLRVFLEGIYRFSTRDSFCTCVVVFGLLDYWIIGVERKMWRGIIGMKLMFMCNDVVIVIKEHDNNRT